jgi:hypothetical protein
LQLRAQVQVFPPSASYQELRHGEDEAAGEKGGPGGAAALPLWEADNMNSVITKELLRMAMEHEANHPPTGEPTFINHVSEEHAKVIAGMFGTEWNPDEKGNMRIGMYLIMTEPLFR